ncbi:hypothetical protein ACFVUS_31225 [Nocardia sp. NPDC058058]|uniref:hypothetical protein n=1 Tax=Nocardia sp. NPDC058058 TaxID=3346317 RepID=UPI0036DA736E
MTGRRRLLWALAVVGARVQVVFGLVAVVCGVVLFSLEQWALALFAFVVRSDDDAGTWTARGVR